MGAHCKGKVERAAGRNWVAVVSGRMMNGWRKGRFGLARLGKVEERRVEVEREDWVVLLGRGLGGLEHDLSKVSRCTAVHKIQFGPVT